MLRGRGAAPWLAAVLEGKMPMTKPRPVDRIARGITALLSAAVTLPFVDAKRWWGFPLCVILGAFGLCDLWQGLRMRRAERRAAGR
jgi:hypothetical protein